MNEQLGFFPAGRLALASSLMITAIGLSTTTGAL